MEQYKGKFIGGRKIKQATETIEKTAGGFSLVQVEYEDKTIEWVSSKMLEKVVSDKSCDASELRDKRVTPIVQEILAMLRDWGIKLGELPYMSALLNQSLDFNQREAILELWSKWMPKPSSPDEVDFITVDRVLKSKRLTLNDVIGNK